MDWKTFIAELSKSLAWPGAVLVIVLLMRPNVARLMNGLKKFKHGEMEISFAEMLDEAKTEIKLQQGKFESGINDPYLLGLAEQMPGLAIVAAWERIERTLVGFLPEILAKDVRRIRMVSFEVPRRLRKDGKISEEIYMLIKKMKALRNKARHEALENQPSISNVEAYQYINLYGYVSSELEKIKGYTMAESSFLSG